MIGLPASNAASVIFSVSRVRSRVRLAGTHSTGIRLSLETGAGAVRIGVGVERHIGPRRL